jgi:hypothetical protein
MSLLIGGHDDDGLVVMVPVLDSENRPYYLWREERFWRKKWREGNCGKNVAGKKTNNLRGTGESSFTSGWRKSGAGPAPTVNMNTTP